MCFHKKLASCKHRLQPTFIFISEKHYEDSDITWIFIKLYNFPNCNNTWKYPSRYTQSISQNCPGEETELAQAIQSHRGRCPSHHLLHRDGYTKMCRLPHCWHFHCCLSHFYMWKEDHTLRRDHTHLRWSACYSIWIISSHLSLLSPFAGFKGYSNSPRLIHDEDINLKSSIKPKLPSANN